MVDTSLFGARFLAEACFLVVFGEEPAYDDCYDEQQGNLRMLKQVSRYGYQYVHGLNSFRNKQSPPPEPLAMGIA